MIKKQSLRSIQKEIWQECRRLVPDATCCYTCTRNFTKKNKQLGHFINKQMLPMPMKYDLRLLRWQCYQCNVRYGGCGSIFYWNLLNEIGQKELESILADFFIQKGDEYTDKEKREYYLKLLEQYKTK